MSKIKYFLIIIFVFILSSCDTSPSQASINEYKADLTFNEAGDMTVIETWNMDYYENLRVRFRDIDYQKYPEDYPFPEGPFNEAVFDEGSVDVRVVRNGVDITDIVGIGYSFNRDIDELGGLVKCEPYRYDCESIFVDTLAYGELFGNMVFTYTYTIKGVVTEYSDISEVNWMLFEYAEGKIEKGEINIQLPNNYNDVDDYNLWTSGVKDSKAKVLSSNTMKIEFNNMKADDYIAFRLLAPTDVFDEIQFSNIFIDDELNAASIIKFQNRLQTKTTIAYISETVYLGLSISAVLLLMGLYIINYKKFLAPYKVDLKGVKYYLPPTENTPAEVAFLYHNKVLRNRDILATLLDLINKGYIDFSEKDAFEKKEDQNIELTLNSSKTLSVLKRHERHLIKWYFEEIGDGEKVNLDQLENYTSLGETNSTKFLNMRSTFFSLVKEAIVVDGIYDTDYKKNKESIRKYLVISPIVLVIGFFLVLILNVNIAVPALIIIVFSLLFYLATFGGDRLTKKGMTIKKQWGRYKNYLNEIMKREDLDYDDIDFLEEKLVFATTFGLKSSLQMKFDKLVDENRYVFPQEKKIEISEIERKTYLYRFYRRSHYFRNCYGRSLNRAQSMLQTSTSYGGSSRGYSGSRSHSRGGSSRSGGGGGGRSR